MKFALLFFFAAVVIGIANAGSGDSSSDSSSGSSSGSSSSRSHRRKVNRPSSSDNQKSQDDGNSSEKNDRDERRRCRKNGQLRTRCENNQDDASEEAAEIPLRRSGDLNVRFNKIAFPNGVPEDWVPLEAKDYPVKGDLANYLKTETKGVSIVTADDFELYGARAENYIDLIGGLPSMVNSDPEDDFWADFREVVKAQLLRSKSLPKDPNDLVRFPDLWSSFDIHDVAEAVHDEYPGYWQERLLEKLFKEGIQIDTDIFPFRSKADFIGTQVRLATLNTWAIGIVAPVNFHLKWYVGRPRPEEVAWKIASGNLTVADGVPEDIVSDVLSMNLPNATSFTAYPEGSPKHPSWPAMHSAASCASLWLVVALKDMTPEQFCEALRVDYAVSYARTVAGVHYPSDNIDGLNLGKEVLLDNLADHLEESCGSNRTAVQDKIERFAFDWAKFDPNTCTIDSVDLKLFME